MSSNIDKISSILNENKQFCKILITIYNKNKSDPQNFIKNCQLIKKLDPVKLQTVYDILNTKPKKRVALDLKWEDDDLNDDDTPVVTASKTATDNGPIKFKKLKKEDAQRLKSFNQDIQQDIKPAQATVPTLQHQQSEKAKPLIGEQDLVINDTNSEITLIGTPTTSTNLDLNDDDESTDVEDDRAWYGVEDYYSNFNEEELEWQTKEQVSRHEREKFQRKKDKARSLKQDLWVTNQMNKSLGKNHQFQPDNESDSDDDVEITNFNIQVDRLIPPFLKDEKIELTSQKTAVNPIKDPEGDLAMMARKGSALVHQKRHDNEKMKRDRENLGDTKIGKVMGIKEQDKDDDDDEDFIRQDNDDDEPGENEEIDIVQQKKSLPVFSVKDQLVKSILENQVIIIVGETGSGKTTQIPQYLDDIGISKNGIIGVTQPRRVAAMSVAKRVSEEIGCQLGDKVGYSIRFEDKTNDKTKIKFMTDGILLRECLMDDRLDKYSCIIIDEAHERTLNTDILLGLFKSILNKRRDLKLIITSATINADKFSTFFGNAPQFEIPGRTFPVEILSNAYNVNDYVESCVQQVLKIHSQSQSKGDILCFMTGQEDIEVCCQVLQERLKEFEHLETLKILPIYSTLPGDLQNKIFNKSKYRKCIVATNIAETSLTVDGIKFVIDCGLSKLKIYNAKLNMDTLQICPISIAQANQRSGRAGRTGPGVCFRLFTLTQQENEMYLQPIPEIQRTNLSNTLLLLKNLGIKNLVQFPFLDSPPLELITSSLYELWLIGALDNFGELTQLGKLMSKFPLEPSLSKLLIKSMEFKCSLECIIIVAMLSVPQIFIRSKERQFESDQARLKFQIAESDHLTLLNVFNLFMKNNSSKWCLKNFLNYKNLKRANDIKLQITTIFNKLQIPVTSCGFNNDDIILKCLCSTFYTNAAKFQKFGHFTNLQNGLTVLLHPTSSLYSMNNFPNYIIYHEILLTSKEYMNYVSVVKPEWLLEFGDNFYNLKNDVEGFDNDKHLKFIEILQNDSLKYDERMVTVKDPKNVVKRQTIKFRSRRGF